MAPSVGASECSVHAALWDRQAQSPFIAKQQKKAFPNRACSLRRTFRYLVRFLSRTPLVERGFLYVSFSWRCFEAPTLTGQETFSHGACPRYEGPNSLKPPSQPLRTYTTRSCDILTLQAYHTPPLPLPSPASDRDLRVGLKHVDLEVKRLEEAAGRKPRVAKGFRGPTHAGIQLIVQLEGEPPSAAHG